MNHLLAGALGEGRRPVPPHPFHQLGRRLGSKSSRVAITFSLSSGPAAAVGEQVPLAADLLPKPQV